MRSCFLLLARLACAATLACLLVASADAAGVDHPIVPGFERLMTGDRDAAASSLGGRVLLGDLGCVHCHKSQSKTLLTSPELNADTAKLASAIGYVLPKQAPVLDAVASRVQPAYLKKFIANPSTTKPGTTMPDVLAGRSDAERAEIAEALTHFLAFSGAAKLSEINNAWAKSGEQLFHQVGCAACHGSQRPDAPQLATSMPLGDLTAKYTVNSLARFIEKPHEVRPSSRMPSLNLNGGEARNIAHYLMKGAVAVSQPTARFRVYEGDFDKLPNFAELTPVKSGKCSGFDLEVATRPGKVAIVYEGYLWIAADANYTFILNSDDGSQLFIDHKLVVNNDGIHSAKQESGTAQLTRGMHPVRVAAFNGGGGFTLDLEIERAGSGRQPVESLLSLTPTPPNEQPADAQRFVADVALADKGRTLFTSLGCANCHAMKFGDKPIASTLEAPRLEALAQPKGGCIGSNPAKGRPQYKLDDRQSAAIDTAIREISAGKASDETQTLIKQTLVTFNCIACHQRDKLGGIEDERNELFETNTKEMGDEGRIPPTLTGVGAKLTPDWLKQMWEHANRVRPYMYTRMPKFGVGNVGHLTSALAAADKLEAVNVPALGVADSAAKKDGRYLVGDKVFGCIKCHDFNGHASTGIRSIDLATSTVRLQHDWFHRYVLDPQQYRPGTRMPTAWPAGQTNPLPNLLGGNSTRQIEAVWLYLSDRNNALFPDGMGRDPIELVADKEPVIYRNFIEGAGNRGIGVGYPEKLNLAFDANDMRLALLWKGSFIDAGKHWRDRGAGHQRPMGDDVLQLPAGSAFAQLASQQETWPSKPAKELGLKWRGYRLAKDGRPTFLYELAGMKIEDEPIPTAGTKPSFVRKFTFTQPIAEHAYLQAIRGDRVEPRPDGSFLIDGNWTVRIQSPTPPQLRTEQKDVIVPINGGPITIEYLW